MLMSNDTYQFERAKAWQHACYMKRKLHKSLSEKKKKQKQNNQQQKAKKEEKNPRPNLNAI